MNYSLGNMLGGGMVAGLDPDAKSYINAVAATGVTVTQTQKNAINAFVESEKAASRWTLHKRLYLPIWSLASANAIDMVTRASGTFVGSVTHASGYIQGNGSTGYFNTNVTPSALSQTLSSASLTALVTQAPSGVAAATAIGSIDGSDTSKLVEFSHLSGVAVIFRSMTATGIGAVQAILARSSQVGIFVSSREGGDRRIIQRVTAGVSTLVNTTGANAGTVPVTGTVQMLRSGFSGGAAYSDGRYGFFAASLGQTVSQSQAFSLNVKTLWETCTGLTIP
jgi:hypothetical protein